MLTLLHGLKTGHSMVVLNGPKMVNLEVCVVYDGIQDKYIYCKVDELE